MSTAYSFLPCCVLDFKFRRSAPVSLHWLTPACSVRRVPFHYLNEHTKPCAANKMSIISLIIRLNFTITLMKLKVLI